MTRHILNTGAIISWISWAERIVLIVACVFFAYKAYYNQPKLTSTLLYQKDDGTLNITCDPSNDAASSALKTSSKELAKVLFNWDKGSIEAYKYQYQEFKPNLSLDSEASKEIYRYVLAKIGSASTKGEIETTSSRYKINFDEKGWNYKKFKNEPRWAVSTTVTQTVTGVSTTPDNIEWNLFITLIEGDNNAFYHIDSFKLTRK